jgi:hypothetical protein
MAVLRAPDDGIFAGINDVPSALERHTALIWQRDR